MSSYPKISIALCTYNAEKHLATQLDSIINQTLAPHEIVVCDDVSTDDTKKILEHYLSLFPDLFKLVFNPSNLGYIKNFEQVISLCNNDYIAIADHDDYWVPTKLEKLYNGLEGALIVYSDSQFMSETGELHTTLLSTNSKFFSKPDPRSFIFSNCVWGHTGMLKKELVTYAFPIPPKAPYDIWLGFIASSVGYINYVDEPLTHWRQHESSYTQQQQNPGKSIQQIKFEQWKNRLEWLEILQASTYNKNRTLIEKLIYYFKEKRQGFSFKLLITVFLNRKLLFAFVRKSDLSIINECRKLCRKVI